MSLIEEALRRQEQQGHRRTVQPAAPRPSVEPEAAAPAAPPAEPPAARRRAAAAPKRRAPARPMPWAVPIVTGVAILSVTALLAWMQLQQARDARRQALRAETRSPSTMAAPAPAPAAATMPPVAAVPADPAEPAAAAPSDAAVAASDAASPAAAPLVTNTPSLPAPTQQVTTVAARPTVAADGWPIFSVKGLVTGKGIASLVILDTGEMLGVADRSRNGSRVVAIEAEHATFNWQGRIKRLRKGEFSDRPLE